MLRLDEVYDAERSFLTVSWLSDHVLSNGWFYPRSRTPGGRRGGQSFGPLTKTRPADDRSWRSGSTKGYRSRRSRLTQGGAYWQHIGTRCVAYSPGCAPASSADTLRDRRTNRSHAGRLSQASTTTQTRVGMTMKSQKRTKTMSRTTNQAAFPFAAQGPGFRLRCLVEPSKGGMSSLPSGRPGFAPHWACLRGVDARCCSRPLRSNGTVREFCCCSENLLWLYRRLQPGGFPGE